MARWDEATADSINSKATKLNSHANCHIALPMHIYIHTYICIIITLNSSREERWKKNQFKNRC